MGNIKNVTLRLEAGGKSIVAGTGLDDYKVFELDGLSGLEFDFGLTGGPQTPNYNLFKQKPLPRQLTIGLHTDGRNRDFLNAFFNPFVRGRLTVTWDKVTRFIYYFPQPVKIEQHTVYRRVSAEVTLVCPEPYWLDADDFGKNIADRQALIAFPAVFYNWGVVPDYKLYSQEVAIVNRGDVPVPASIVFTARGDVINPCLTLNDNEYIRAVVEMEKGDTITFSTDPDDLYAQMNGADILNITDPNMTFFQLPPGTNIVRYSADDGTVNLNVFIYFRARYLGV